MHNISIANSALRQWLLGMMCWRSWIQYVCKHRCLWTMSCTVQWGSCNSKLALLTDLCGLLVNAVSMCSTTSSCMTHFMFSSMWHQSSCFSQCSVLLQNWFMSGCNHTELVLNTTVVHEKQI
jgi:hypothetical protein